MAQFNRRQFIKATAALATGTVLAGCGSSILPELRPQLGAWPDPMPDPTWRWLNRVTFGPRPGERRRVTEIGPAAFLEEQLAPEMLPELPVEPRLSVRRLESLRLDPADLFDVEPEIAVTELQRAKLLRAVYSSRQLYEVMVDFWTNHFSIDQNKGDCAWLKTIDDRNVIRPHALGNFFDLLRASAHSPAMLYYLDNQENHVGNPNENYARELLELHTVGVAGGYSQSDVQELARCLTGWRVKKRFYRGQFTFDADQHDDGPKRVMGLPVPAGAQKIGGEQVIEMLAYHPATAHHITTKLVRRFVADDPTPPLVARAAQTFQETRGDIKAVLRTILLSPEILAPAVKSAKTNHELVKLKRPFEFVTSTLRQLNARTEAGPGVLTYLAEMGQPLFQWPTPDGFPDRASAWNSTLLTRWRFALALTHKRLPGTRLDLPALLAGSSDFNRARRLDQLATLLLGKPLPPGTASQLSQAFDSDEVLVAALLGSPAFQWK